MDSGAAGVQVNPTAPTSTLTQDQYLIANSMAISVVVRNWHEKAPPRDRLRRARMRHGKEERYECVHKQTPERERKGGERGNTVMGTLKVKSWGGAFVVSRALASAPCAQPPPEVGEARAGALSLPVSGVTQQGRARGEAK